MQDDKRPLLNELCYNLYQRNQIELRRRSAKNKIYYYEQIKKTVQAYKGTNSRVISLSREIRAVERLHLAIGPVTGSADKLNETRRKLKIEENNLELIKSMKSKPLKWLDKAQELNNVILKHRAAYMKARYDTSKLTCSSRKRVHRLCTLLQASIIYQNGTGFVDRVVLKHVDENGHNKVISSDEFEALYREVEASKAIDKVLRAKEK